MILLTVDEVINLHEKLINMTGGSQGMRSRDLLESAIYGTSATFDGVELYKTVTEKAARLAYSIIKNHPFVDGNKRAGVFVMLMTLKLNDIQITYSQQELISLGLGIADSSIEYKDIVEWVSNHL